MNIIFKNIPNILTISRILAVPLFVLYMYENQFTAALIVFILSAITDVLDGIIARKFDLITKFGKIADPFADKFMQIAALFMLSMKNMIPNIIPWLVLAKELFMVISGIYLIKKKYDTSSRWFGKLTSVLLFAAIILTFFGVPRNYTDILFWVCVGMTIFAAVMYTRDYFKKKNSNEENSTDIELDS